MVARKRMSPQTLPAWIPAVVRPTLDRVVHDYQLTSLALDRQGPRFLALRARYRGRAVALKVCTVPQDVNACFRLRREAEFLRFVTNGKLLGLRRLAPRYIASGMKGAAWYIREYISGTSFEPVGSTLGFRPGFYRPAVLRQLTKALHDLHTIEASDLPIWLRSSFVTYDTVQDKIAFLQAHRPALRASLKKYLDVDLAFRWLQARRTIYDHVPQRLTHHECFSVHFFWSAGRLRMIDWESVTWANPVRDWVTLWMQSFGHSAWQTHLRNAAKKETAAWLGANFAAIWETSVVMNALFVLAVPPARRPSARDRAFRLFCLRTIRDYVRTVV